MANKSQIPILNDKTFPGKSLFGFLNFGYWNLFVIWDLKFGI
jgi:hypothetical protein